MVIERGAGYCKTLACWLHSVALRLSIIEAKALTRCFEGSLHDWIHGST